ncbi:MAG: tRNA (adenosine(37)-N6)-threonylcarbamoyltransferase complex dimerization subunit type 1 TsaB [Halobacteria archaeon]|nr:tRNA (adenosine(37)-N6)-threonylcarbamoyltransferase complex dimerization subunit type 1 TsaB [Halobacteria archaeon]
MTRLLAIETATSACSAALSVNGHIQERHALAPRQHAALILPMIESLLVEADLQVGQLDALLFGQGPGSFTGVRIAASVVQGIAFGARLPVVAVSTLATLALGAMDESGEAQIMVALDARMSEVYWGVYRQGEDGLPVQQIEECVCAPDEVPLPPDGRWVGAGSGWDSYGEMLMTRSGERMVRVLPDLEPRARDLVRLGADRFDRGMVIPPEQALPVYLRDQVVRDGRGT